MIKSGRQGQKWDMWQLIKTMEVVGVRLFNRAWLFGKDPHFQRSSSNPDKMHKADCTTSWLYTGRSTWSPLPLVGFIHSWYRWSHTWCVHQRWGCTLNWESSPQLEVLCRGPQIEDAQNKYELEGVECISSGTQNTYLWSTLRSHQSNVMCTCMSVSLWTWIAP